MSTTGLDTFDATVQESNLWLKAMMAALGRDDRHVAYVALRAALHALRDRIGPENAAHLGAQFPMLLRGVYYEGWHMAGTPTRERHQQDFLTHVRECMPRNLNVDPEAAARATFEVMWQRLDPGEVAKIIRILPGEIRDLWPRVAREN
jgi:uncharacterized protein (DUF2267 family)